MSNKGANTAPSFYLPAAVATAAGLAFTPASFDVSGATVDPIPTKKDLTQATSSDVLKFQWTNNSTSTAINVEKSPHENAEEILNLKPLARQAINKALETETGEFDEENFSQEIEGFILQFGLNGIDELYSELKSNAENEAVWNFVRILGEDNNLETFHRRREILIELLDSDSAGIRSSVSSALGFFKDLESADAMQRRASLEKNRFVKAALEAQLRAVG